MPFYAKKVAALGFLVFLVLWVVGTVRGIMSPYPPPAPVLLPSVVSIARENYQASNAGTNNLKQLGLIETPTLLVLDKLDVEKIRIHEKRALLTLGSPAFDADSAIIHAAIKAHQAEIFTYKKTGLEPNRSLTLEIGVSPDRFDDLVEQLRAVGHLSAISVEQKDRTAEFRKLHAQRQGLKKYLESILKLREGKNLSLEDALRLEQKAQDLDKEIQALGAQFGELLGKESYYHVHLTLVEYQPGDRRDRSYTVSSAVLHGLLWAVAWWFGSALAVALVAATGISIGVLRQKPVP